MVVLTFWRNGPSLLYKPDCQDGRRRPWYASRRQFGGTDLPSPSVLRAEVL